MEVRRATREDIPDLVEANRCIAREVEHFELDRDTVTIGVTAVFDKEERGYYMVATKEGQFAGCIQVTYEWSDWRNKNSYWIQDVYVRPEHRRQGVFKSLYEYVAADTRVNAGALRLYVDQDNVVAQKTYAAVGMSESHYRMFELDYLVKH
jgi:GNAT superfamily N-acetyltransferase